MAPRHYDRVYANSHATAILAKQIYHLDAHVVYPSLPKHYFLESICHQVQDYFVYVGRLACTIREVDRIIRLFNDSRQQLIIIGS